jgi:hypothetical protein
MFTMILILFYVEWKHCFLFSWWRRNQEASEIERSQINTYACPSECIDYVMRIGYRSMRTIIMLTQYIKCDENDLTLYCTCLKVIAHDDWDLYTFNSSTVVFKLVFIMLVPHPHYTSFSCLQNLECALDAWTFVQFKSVEYMRRIYFR